MHEFKLSEKSRTSFRLPEKLLKTLHGAGNIDIRIESGYRTPEDQRALEARLNTSIHHRRNG